MDESRFSTMDRSNTYITVPWTVLLKRFKRWTSVLWIAPSPVLQHHRQFYISASGASLQDYGQLPQHQGQLLCIMEPGPGRIQRTGRSCQGGTGCVCWQCCFGSPPCIHLSTSQQLPAAGGLWGNKLRITRVNCCGSSRIVRLFHCCMGEENIFFFF